MPPAAPSRGAVGGTKNEDQIYVVNKAYLQLSANRGKAKLRLDHDTVFRDANLAGFQVKPPLSYVNDAIYK
jgi:hypothetical protein